MSEAELLASMESLRAQLALSRRRELLWRGFVLAVAVAFVVTFASLNSKTDDIIATRRDSRFVACQQDNIFRDGHNGLVDNVQKAVGLVAVPNPNRTPEQQAAVDRFVADFNATIEQSRIPLRDCSLAAIEQFYKPK